jgi:hypothetical protein
MRRVVLKRAGAAVLAFAAFGIACGDEGVGPGDDEPKTWRCSFMPLAVGNNWVFDTYDITWNEFEKFGELTMLITPKLRKVSGLFGYECEFSYSNPSSVTYATFAYCRDTCFKYGDDKWWMFISMNMAGKQANDIFSGIPVRFVGREDVTVPAGSFADCMHLRGHGSVETIDVYYAEGVGPVYWSCEYGYEWPYPEFADLKLKSYQLKNPG